MRYFRKGKKQSQKKDLPKHIKVRKERNRDTYSRNNGTSFFAKMVIFLLLFSALTPFIPTSSADYIIEGDKVYIDDEYVYLAAEPHTIMESSDVVFELISKQFGGEIDVAFGINNTLMSVSNPRLWNGTSWNPLNKQIQVVNRTHQGYNRWYLLKNVNINEDVLYSLKLTVDVVFNTSGKYFFGVKRSIDPISAGYYLDPWWAGSWDYKKLIPISNNIDDYSMFINVSKATGGGDVNCSGNCNDNFSDIRFIHDNTSVLPYWREYISTGAYAFFWVNNSYNDTCIEIFYGNTAATYAGNGTGVFINFTNSTYQQEWTFGSYSHNTENNSIYIYGEVGAGGSVWNPDDYSGTDWVFEWSSRCLYSQSLTSVYSSNAKTVAGGWRSTTGNTDLICYRSNDSTNRPLFEPFYDTDYYIWRMGVRDDDERVDYYLYNETRNGTGGSAPNVGFWDPTSTGDFDECYITDGTGASPRMDIWIRWMFIRLYATPEPSWGTAGAELAQTDVLPPTNVYANTNSNTDIGLNWTIGTNATHTYIVRKTGGYPSSRIDGTNIYNSTGTDYTDSGLDSMTVYYYSLWSFNSTRGNWSGNVTATNHTGPTNPTNVIDNISTTYINISWTNGTRADHTILMHSASAYPTSVTDGTVLVNSTGAPYHNDTTYYSGYYTLFSWNNVTNLYSTGYDVQYGSLTINVYDENTSTAISGWDIFVTNEDGSTTYESTNNTNPLVIDMDDLPIGDDTAIKINATYYDFRLYYMDLEAGNQYELNAYLSPENISELYVLIVIDENDLPVADATMQIQQYINETAGYENVSIRITDANGQVEVYLIPGNWNSLYKIIITKTGYETEIADYVPDATYHGAYYPKYFQITTTQEGHDIVTFLDIITFNATMNATGVITVWYDDENTNTINTSISIYQYYNGTQTLNHTDSRTGDDSFSFTYADGNTSQVYAIVLYLNHTDLGYEVVWIYIQPIRDTASEEYVERLFDNVFGGFDLGWTKTFLIFLPCLIPLVVFASKNVGLGIIGSGLYLGFSTFFIDVSSAVTYATLAGIIIVMGMVVIIIKKGRSSV